MKSRTNILLRSLHWIGRIMIILLVSLDSAQNLPLSHNHKRLSAVLPLLWRGRFVGSYAQCVRANLLHKQDQKWKEEIEKIATIMSRLSSPSHNEGMIKRIW